ncbi:uncharacterized protein MELLADRAFT_96050 [Melampsora larici-populina 98AG31]|uniref:Uncharacterized protein n=1 Tax=Melampsora larici-populina (strain 98AG31 / pathotype 3-4-7) TaxID=747676 RepID=F4SAS5_MELLP|nr:uncharacterized protein MELLADRAFT_96050 [Melampsora larici-populina 98AG31]EGF98251.1 hypothetical protein MELLADRAFT_96050 [Melampsora larici-populina 98AG31]
MGRLTSWARPFLAPYVAMEDGMAPLLDSFKVLYQITPRSDLNMSPCVPHQKTTPTLPPDESTDADQPVEPAGDPPRRHSTRVTTLRRQSSMTIPPKDSQKSIVQSDSDTSVHVVEKKNKKQSQSRTAESTRTEESKSEASQSEASSARGHHKKTKKKTQPSSKPKTSKRPKKTTMVTLKDAKTQAQCTDQAL